MPSHVVGIVDVGEKARQALESSARFQQLEPGKLVLPALHTTTDTNKCPVDREFVASGKQSSPFLDPDWPACVSMGAPMERVHVLGV